MYNKLKKTKIRLILLLMTIIFWDPIPLLLAQTSQTCSNPKTLDVLVIELDPFLKAKDNIRASVFLNQDKDLVVNDLVEDIVYSSHRNVVVNIVKKEHLDEFATFTEPIPLKNGKESNTLDEETWLEIMKDGWWDFWNDPYVKNIKPFSYDYDYLINKFDLVNRRNKDEFDEVWLVNVDPVQTFESIMVGSSAYWINGTPMIKNTTNFKIMNVSISRPDANFECFGHAAENILDNVFGSRYRSYDTNAYTVNNIDDLNLWERFILNNYATPGYSSVGNIHFAPNSVDDYDWQNTTIVQSSWIDWLDYPNLTGKTKASNNKDWVPFTNRQFSAARQHHRWWFSLMPHICEGRTKEGYSYNWWNYLFNGNYVTKITNNGSRSEYKINEPIILHFKLEYLTGEVEYKTLNGFGINDLNIQIENDTIIELENGMLKTKCEGKTNIRVYYDNKYDDFEINVSSMINQVAQTEDFMSLKVFPNPAKDEIFIETELRVEKVEIYSLSGNVHIQENNFKGIIPVSTLPQGIYFVNILTNKGLSVHKIAKN